MLPVATIATSMNQQLPIEAAAEMFGLVAIDPVSTEVFNEFLVAGVFAVMGHNVTVFAYG